MDEQRKPRAREKKIIGEGKGVEKQGEGLGTGPVNNTGSYQDRREQQAAAQRPQQAQNPYGQQRPQQGSPFGQQNPFGQQRYKKKTEKDRWNK